MKPNFKNRENPHVVYKVREGSNVVVNHDYWISRAPAVNGVILFQLDNGFHALTIKRSKIMDNPNKMAAVSGYLDWDESGYDAIIREIYEETGMFVPDYKKALIFEKEDKQPFYTNSEPTNNYQNVSLSYLFVFDFETHKNLFPKDIEKFKCREVSEVKLMPMFDVFNDDTIDWAFNHNKLIHRGLKYFNKDK